jgi:hypothetical protein
MLSTGRELCGLALSTRTHVSHVRWNQTTTMVNNTTHALTMRITVRQKRSICKRDSVNSPRGTGPENRGLTLTRRGSKLLNCMHSLRGDCSTAVLVSLRSSKKSLSRVGEWAAKETAIFFSVFADGIISHCTGVLTVPSVICLERSKGNYWCIPPRPTESCQIFRPVANLLATYIREANHQHDVSLRTYTWPWTTRTGKSQGLSGSGWSGTRVKVGLLCSRTKGTLRHCSSMSFWMLLPVW